MKIWLVQLLSISALLRALTFLTLLDQHNRVLIYFQDTCEKYQTWQWFQDQKIDSDKSIFYYYNKSQAIFTIPTIVYLIGGHVMGYVFIQVLSSLQKFRVRQTFTKMEYTDSEKLFEILILPVKDDQMLDSTEQAEFVHMQNQISISSS